MDFVIKVECHLKLMEYRLAMEVLMNPENLRAVEEEGMELISKICDVGLESAVDFDDISVCSEMLNYICGCYNPKLALVSTLEQAETFLYSPKFNLILKCIQIIFARHPTKRAATYSWTLGLFSKHLREFHKFPGELKNKFTEGHENLFVENDPRVRSIFSYYKDVHSFYIPVVTDFVVQCQGIKEKEESDAKELGNQERILKSCLVDLLGAPLIYFDLTSPINDKEVSKDRNPRSHRSQLQLKPPQMKSKSQKTEARLIAEKIMKQIVEVNMDSSFFLKWTERKCLPQPILTELDEIEYDEELEEVDFQNTAIANYFYLVYVEGLSPNTMPMTYTGIHLFHVQIPLINALLTEGEQNYLTIQKGLLLAQKLIDQIMEPLGSEFLTGEMYSSFVEKLTQLIIYFEVRSIRELSIGLLKSYFWKFNPAGKYMFFQFILVKVGHPGLVGFMIGQMKDCIASTLDGKGEDLKEMELHFQGPHLSKMLLQICILRDGASTDLLEVNDHIMGVLNLLRYLLLRDGSTNKSGILDDMPKIEALLLKPLRTALDLTKAHYSIRMKEIQDPDYTGGDQPALEGEFKKSVLIGGKEVELTDVSVEDQVSAMSFGLHSMDIMESLLVRVNECCDIARRSRS